MGGCFVISQFLGIGSFIASSSDQMENVIVFACPETSQLSQVIADGTWSLMLRVITLSETQHFTYKREFAPRNK